MENKKLKIKIENQLKKIKEMINLEDSYEKVKVEQKVLNELLKEYLEES